MGTVVDLQLKCCGGIGPSPYLKILPSKLPQIALVLASKVATYSYLCVTSWFAAYVS